MSLLEALLLDPLKMNVWIAVRADGIAGTGTQNDPYDGSTQAKFDAVMNGLAAYTRINLGPGTFQTNGYADGVSGGWQPKPGVKIVGSGADVTILQLAGSSMSAHYYAIGHSLGTGGHPNLMDFFEVSDLTIDCHLAAFSGTSAACGAVRAMGNHAKIRRVKVVNWGTKSTSRPCFVLAAITADPPSGANGVEDCGIEECLAVSPDTNNVGPVTIFHAGGMEAAATNVVGFGVGPCIRNCFADAGASNLSSPEIRGLSMGWCKAGIVEGNQAHNLTYGTFQQATSAQDIVVRNNWFKNVNKGAFLGGIAASQGTGSLSLSAPTATVTIPSGHNLLVNDVVLISTSPATSFNGIVVTVTSVTSTTFTFKTSITSPPSATISAVQKLFGVSNLTIEGNVAEVPTATSGSLIGIHVNDSWAASTPAQDATYPTYLFGKVLVRDNKMRYVDDAPPVSGYVGYGLQINSALDLLVRNNVITCQPTPAIQNDRCGSVAYFNNQTPAGALIQGANGDNGNPYEELSTEADFALVISLFNRRS